MTFGRRFAQAFLDPTVLCYRACVDELLPLLFRFLGALVLWRLFELRVQLVLFGRPPRSGPGLGFLAGRGRGEVGSGRGLPWTQADVISPG
jgi:hypothetical protein